MKNRLHIAARTACLTVLAGCALASGAAAAQELRCAAFPEPRAAKLEWVAPYMVYNGVPMSIKSFDSDLKPDDILAFYRRAWSGGPAGTAPVENVVDPWQTIGVARGKCFYTVQVQSRTGNGSTGLLSVTEAPDKARVNSGQTLPMMAGSSILNDIEHRDDGKNARTILLSNTFSAESNADFYRQTLSDQGWRPVSSYQMTTKRGPGITIIMKRGLAEASLVISRAGSKTTVLANLVDQP